MVDVGAVNVECGGLLRQGEVLAVEFDREDGGVGFGIVDWEALLAVAGVDGVGGAEEGGHGGCCCGSVE